LACAQIRLWQFTTGDRVTYLLRRMFIESVLRCTPVSRMPAVHPRSELLHLLKLPLMVWSHQSSEAVVTTNLRFMIEARWSW
jgi:hypothetical protein